MNDVILVHGLYMNRWCMHWLQQQLRGQGHQVHVFDYPTLRRPLAQQAADLAAFTRAHARSDVVHFVGHSLGGLLIRHLAAQTPELFSGHCVTLGTPHQGSQVAHWAYRWAPFSLGRSHQNGLDGQVPAWPQPCALGSIAGDKPIAIGTLVLPWQETHDGMVLLQETRIEGMADHIVLPTNHTGLLLHRDAARQVAYFLAHGQFQRPADAQTTNIPSKLIP